MRIDGRRLPAAEVPDGLELRHLRSFVAVAEDLNFSRAAERLYISQPALSRQIRALEELVGCELVRRTTHWVALTTAGEVLLARARTLLAEAGDAVAETRAAAGELEARIGRLWGAVANAAGEDVDLRELRAAYEGLHAGFEPPRGTTVRSVNAGGVPSLVVGLDEGPPSLLYLHGGGYFLGSAYGFRHVAGALASAAAASVLIADYRLAPEHPFPAALEDAAGAYAWIVETVPAGSVTVVGDSSGGGLAMTLLLSLAERGLPRPGGAVLLCPDVTLTDDVARRLAEDDPRRETLVRMKRYLIDSYSGGATLPAWVIDPVRADLVGLPPLLIQAATNDPVAEEARRLTAGARAAGVDVQEQLYPGALHGFQYFWSFLPTGTEALSEAGHFAQRIRSPLRVP